jgi:DNA-binding NarL/FixJ family response regulator
LTEGCYILPGNNHKKEEHLLTSIHILIADDFEEWRHRVRLLLHARPEWQIVCEVSDGSEAVQKAEALKPDLVVLDIGLPKLNGIEAARRIRQLSPNSRIVFVSLVNSLDMVQAALSTGALGYVYKIDSRSELLLAVDAALLGKQFVSSSIKDYKFTDIQEAKVPHRHEVLFYSEDAVFLDNLTDFIAVALEAGDMAVAIATESHQDGLIQRLKARGVDIDGAIREGTYISSDAAKSLSTFMVNGMPDSDRFFEIVGGLIRTAAKVGKREHSRVAACGEIGPFLWAEGKADAAVRLEQITDEFAKTYEVDIFCAYSLSSFRGEKGEKVFQSICAQHTAVYRQ